MIKASDGDTVLDEKYMSPIKTQHSESINCVSKLANSETKVTETNRFSNCREKSQQQDPVFFYGKNNCYIF